MCSSSALGCFPGLPHAYSGPPPSLSPAGLTENNPQGRSEAWPVQINACKVLGAELQLVPIESV